MIKSLLLFLCTIPLLAAMLAVLQVPPNLSLWRILLGGVILGVVVVVTGKAVHAASPDATTKLRKEDRNSKEM